MLFELIANASFCCCVAFDVRRLDIYSECIHLESIYGNEFFHTLATICFMQFTNGECFIEHFRSVCCITLTLKIKCCFFNVAQFIRQFLYDFMIVCFSDIYKIELRSTSCTRDSDCDTDNCYYCLSKGICSQFNDEYCDDNECGEGDGDCDENEQCSPLICGDGNFLSFHPLLFSCTNPTRGSIIGFIIRLSGEEACSICKKNEIKNAVHLVNNLVLACLSIELHLYSI